jgi:dephospho-CoA kinase
VGGIGAGKTAVTDHLTARGFTVVDADLAARTVVEPGRPAWRALRDAFGDAVLRDDETIDRAFLAEVVFHEPAALRRLNHITHGHIGAEIVRQLETARGPVVFVAIPLFRPEHRDVFSLDEVWAVQVSPATALARLVASRGLTERDATARLESQPTNEERGSIVDRVIWNEGTLDKLIAQVDALVANEGLTGG